ncbi:aromatic ring-opening dioxygenase LigA [Cellulomonas hominis]
MSTVATTGNAKGVRVIGIITAVAGLVLLIAGGVTWGSVSSHLADERITVSDDAANFAGQDVTTPWAAFAQAAIIQRHALTATDGKTYAELGQDDPLRATAMNASFLRASLFTSVVAFGVAALVMGLGVLFVLVGYVFYAIGGRRTVVTAPAAPVEGHATV